MPAPVRYYSDGVTVPHVGDVIASGVYHAGQPDEKNLAGYVVGQVSNSPTPFPNVYVHVVGSLKNGVTVPSEDLTKQ